MLKFEILLSCMNLGDEDIISHSKITSDTLIVNQCREDGYGEYTRGTSRIRVFSVNDRGLTKSRNFAIEHSDADICLLCDDDEVFSDSCERDIITAYKNLPQADIIIFDIENHPAKWGKEIKKLGARDIMSVSSWQISFRRESLIKAGIRFDENMGAGTPNGAEEEFKFLTDCRKAGLCIYYYPAVIASVAQEQSTWFSGFDEKFFINRGNTTRYIMGLPLSVAYAFYYTFTKRKKISADMKWTRAFRLTLKGIRENRLTKLKEKQNGKNT